MRPSPIRSSDLTEFIPMRYAALFLQALLLTLVTLNVDAQTATDDCRDRVDPAASVEQDRIAALKYSCLRVEGRRVLVAEAGEATRPTVLLVHGLGSSAHRDWRAMYPVLARRFHVVALDLPGFGASDPLPGGYSFEQLDTTLVAVTQQLSLDRFNLVGHSLGGAISMYFASRHPERIDRLVLINAAGVLLQQVFARQLIDANRSTGSGALDGLISVLGASSDSVIDLVESQLDLSSWLMSNPAMADALFGGRIHVDAAMGLVKHDFTTALRTIRAPTMILWGSDDRVTPQRTGELLAGRLADARLQIIPGAAHMPMTEAPDELNRALMASLAEPSPPKQTLPASGTSQGDVSCTNQSGAVYSGVFARLSLSNCPNARIENARASEISIDNSNVTLMRVTVEGDGVALQTRNSTVTATVIDLSGKVALRADASRVDLAGAKLRAREKAVDVTSPSRIYFSVSEIDAPDYRGDAHFVWPPR
jgi:pimeloyl-ACP methyl ester carboxylesterase